MDELLLILEANCKPYFKLRDTFMSMTAGMPFCVSVVQSCINSVVLTSKF